MLPTQTFRPLMSEISCRCFIPQSKAQVPCTAGEEAVRPNWFATSLYSTMTESSCAEPPLNVHESLSPQQCIFTQIPATKSIHLALVFFARLFLLILLFTAPRKGERGSPAHFLMSILQIPQKQPLFLIGI